MGQALGCYQVDQSNVAIKEQFGKFTDVLEPGCHCLPWCLGYQIAGGLLLRVQQLDVKYETKTKDNVFVNVVASVQYRVVADKASEAFYKLTNVRVQKAVDPEVAALLDDSDVSRFGSDVEDLEEGFIVQANLCEDKEDDEEKAHKSNGNNKHVLQVPAYATLAGDCGPLDGSSNGVTDVHCVVEKPRVRRLIDEQFDLLERQEYGIDDDNSDYDDYYGDYEENYRAEDESLAKKLNLSLSNHVMDNQELDGGGKYNVPAEGGEQEKNGEYRQMLVQAIHTCAIKFPEVASTVVHLLMDFVGDTNVASAMDVVICM